MPVPSPWTAGAVHHITRWPRAQLSQHYRGVLLTPSALSGHRHPASLRLPTIAVTRNSVSGLLQTTKGKYRRPESSLGKGPDGGQVQPWSSHLFAHREGVFSCTPPLSCRLLAFGGENNLQVGSEQKELH